MNRLSTCLAALAAAAVPLVALTQSLPSTHAAPDPVAAAIGQIVYTRYCAACHGTSGRGDGPMAPELRTRTPDLTRLAAANRGKYPYFQVVQVIDGRRTFAGHGTADMPVWGEIFPKTDGDESPDVETAVARITHYLWSIQQPPAPATLEPAGRHR